MLSRSDIWSAVLANLVLAWRDFSHFCWSQIRHRFVHRFFMKKDSKLLSIWGTNKRIPMCSPDVRFSRVDRAVPLTLKVRTFNTFCVHVFKIITKTVESYTHPQWILRSRIQILYLAEMDAQVVVHWMPRTRYINITYKEKWLSLVRHIRTVLPNSIGGTSGGEVRRG